MIDPVPVNDKNLPGRDGHRLCHWSFGFSSQPVPCVPVTTEFLGMTPEWFIHLFLGCPCPPDALSLVGSVGETRGNGQKGRRLLYWSLICHQAGRAWSSHLITDCQSIKWGVLSSLPVMSGCYEDRSTEQLGNRTCRSDVNRISQILAILFISENEKKSHIFSGGLWAYLMGGGNQERKGDDFLFYSIAPGTMCLSPTGTKYWELISFHQEFLGKKWDQRLILKNHRRSEEQLGQHALTPHHP